MINSVDELKKGQNFLPGKDGSNTAEREACRFTLRWWQLPLAVCILFCLVRGLFFIHYETLDDAVMELIVAGVGPVTSPNAHIIDSHCWIGAILSHCYKMAPQFPWYASYLEVVQVIAVLVLALIFFESIGRAKEKQSLWLWSSLAATVLQPLVRFQFTTTAMLLGTAGCLSLVHSLEGKNWNFQRRSFWLLVGCSCFLGATLVRVHSALLCAVLLLIFVAVAYSKTGKWRRLSQGFLLTAVVAASVLMVGHVDDRFYNQDPGWRYFHTFRPLGGYFHDYKRVIWSTANIPAFQRVGWNVADLAMMQTHFFVDPAVFSLENLTYLIDQTHARSSNFSLWRFLRQLTIIAFKLYSLPFLLLLASWSGLAVRSSLRWRYLILSTAVFALLATIGTLLKSEPRVFLPVLLWLVVIALYFSVRDNEGPQSSSADSSSAGGGFFLSSWRKVVCLGAIGLSIGLCISSGLNAKSRSHELNEMLRKFHPVQGKLYLVWGSSWRYEGKLPFESVAQYYENFRLMPGFLAHTPFCAEALERCHARSVREGLLDGKAYLISTPYLNRAYFESLRAHYGIEVRFNPVFEHEASDFHVYRLTADDANRKPVN